MTSVKTPVLLEVHYVGFYIEGKQRKQDAREPGVQFRFLFLATLRVALGKSLHLSVVPWLFRSA